MGSSSAELADRAGVDASTVSRMEACDKKPIRGLSENIVAVVDALEKAGVEITEDGVRLVAKPRR